MSLSRVIVVVAFVLVLALPFIVRRTTGLDAAGADEASARRGPASLVIVTPHVGQIRDEFGAGFARWHARVYPNEAAVWIDWRVPGGTSEIIKQLRAEYEAAARAASREGAIKVLKWAEDGASCEVDLPAKSMGADLMFGGGHYEHDQLKTGVKLKLPVEGQTVEVLVRLSEPAGFPIEKLVGGSSSWFASNVVGNQELFEKDQYWIGAALSAFGIVYNRELIVARGMKEPRSFKDLTDFGYFRALALADPRQSGSVTTTYESILNKEGWDEGWRILREMGANSRSFASASTKPPVDVSQGEALAGLAIDFYGRAQAQAVMREGEDAGTSRVGYVDPPGAVYIDADPVSVLRGCPNPAMARRFIEFCMSDEAQALWQLPPVNSEAGKRNPEGPGDRKLGPDRYALRRLPSRQAVYEQYGSYFVDRVNPFEVAAALPDRKWRRAIDVMMGAFAVDTLDDLRPAWEAFNLAKRDPAFPAATLAEMERELHAFPTGDDVRRLASKYFPGEPLPDDAYLDFTPEKADPKGPDNCRRITATWSSLEARTKLKVVYTEFFRERYRRVVELSRGAK